MYSSPPLSTFHRFQPPTSQTPSKPSHLPIPNRFDSGRADCKSSSITPITCIQRTIVIPNSPGPVKSLCHMEGTRYASVLYNESPLYIYIRSHLSTYYKHHLIHVAHMIYKPRSPTSKCSQNPFLKFEACLNHNNPRPGGYK